MLLSNTSDICFQIINESKTEAQPDGSASTAWENLKNKYQPDTGASKMTLLQKFNVLKMTNDSHDPEQFITDLEIIRGKLRTMNIELTCVELIMKIIYNLPEKRYENISDHLLIRSKD